MNRLRTQFILLCLASIAALGFALAGAAYFSVRSLEARLLEEARLLALQQAEQIKQPLEKIIGESQAADFKRQFSAMLHANPAGVGQNSSLVSIIVRMSAGDQLLTYRFTPEGSEVEVAPGGNAEEQVRIPLQLQGRTTGELELVLSRGAILRRIENYGADIRAHSAGLTLALFVLMTLTFYLLWTVFRHYLELAREKERQERMAYVGTLAAGLAHEIRNPLNAMNLNLDLIREELHDPRTESQQRNLELVQLLQDEARQLNHTLTGFLNFALPKKTAFEPCDLSAILGETLALLQPEFRQQDVRLETHAPRSVVIHGHAESLRQALLNLLLNAIQAMNGQQREKRIRVALEAEPPRCRLTIADSGPGIPEQNRAKIFEAFFTTRPGGSGFGLAIARRIIADHGGELRIAASGPDGATFAIELPLEVKTERPANP